MEEKAIVYVAGNPDLYPLEYYDEKTGSFQGAIPELLADFAGKSGYDLRYYQPGKLDRRDEMAKYQQVDLISGCVVGEQFANVAEEPIYLAQTPSQEGMKSYFLLTANTAPARLHEKLSAYMEEVSWEEWINLVIQASVQKQLRTDLTPVIAGVGVGLAILLAFLAIRVRKYKTMIRNLKDDKETNPITGAGNRQYLERYWHQFLHMRHRPLFSMVYFYVNTAKVERTSGLEKKQATLCYAAAVLNEFTGDNELMAQVSDSGFVILKQIAKEETLLQWLKTVLDRIRSGSSVVIPVSAGVYAMHESDKDLTAVISNAGQAARAAFEQKDPWLFCTKEVLQDYAERKRLLEEMQFGLDNNQFRIYLQVYVDGITRKIVGVESLARWIHPDRGILFPAQFLPLLEQERLVPKLNERMLEESCAFLDRLEDLGITDVFLSYRLTQQTFFDPDFPALCQRILEKHNWDRKNLIFELEDGVDRRETKGLVEKMEKLKALGVRIASSNFGGNLQLYPVDVLKLNRELVRHLGSRKGDLIVRDMIRTGHNLGLLVVAAGVEKEAQAQKLAALGCDWQKGVCFSVPLPVREASIIIQEERGVTAKSAASEALVKT